VLLEQTVRGGPSGLFRAESGRLSHLFAENVEGRSKLASDVVLVVDEQSLEECLAELASEPIRGLKIGSFTVTD
jgi:hypothetical protein